MTSKTVRTGPTKSAAAKPAATPVAPEAKAVAAAAVKPGAAKAAPKAAPVKTPVETVTASAEPAAIVEQAVEAAKPMTAAVPAPVAQAIETPVAAAAEAASAIHHSVEKETQIMQTTTEATVNKTQALFGEMNDRTKGAMEKSAKMVEEMNEFAKGNLEAMVESSRIAANGMESIGQEAAEYSRKSFEQATATMKSMASVKSPTELFKLQSDYMRSAFDMYVAEASKTTEHMMKLAGDAAQPLSNRMAIAADKVKVAA